MSEAEAVRRMSDAPAELHLDHIHPGPTPGSHVPQSAALGVSHTVSIELESPVFAEIDDEISVHGPSSTDDVADLHAPDPLPDDRHPRSALRTALGSLSNVSPGAVGQLSLCWPISESLKGKLLDAYLRETSTWCEATDTLRHFSTKCSCVLVESDCFLAAALALSSRQLDVTTDHPHSVSLELYQFTIRTLIERVSEDLDSSILASCVMLCVFEMMQSPVCEWRRHLQGCAQLFKSRGWNGSSGGYVAACFWPFARIGVLLEPVGFDC